MLEKSQEYLRLAMALAAILIGLSIAYHYVIYIPEQDRARKLEAASTAQIEVKESGAKAAAAEKAALDRQTNYRVCLSSAQFNYEARWDSTCRERSQAADQSRAECLEKGTTAEWCRSYYPPLASKDCQLPKTLSDGYDDALREEKKRCLEEARAGVLTSELDLQQN
jgi:hypothetical protein